MPAHWKPGTRQAAPGTDVLVAPLIRVLVSPRPREHASPPALSYACVSSPLSLTHALPPALSYARISSSLSLMHASPPTLSYARAPHAVTQPMDVLRTRAQAGLQGSAVGVLAAASGIIAKEGVRGLFSGFAPRVTKRGLQTALVFSIFEEVRPRVDGAVVRAVRSVRALN